MKNRRPRPTICCSQCSLRLALRQQLRWRQWKAKQEQSKSCWFSGIFSARWTFWLLGFHVRHFDCSWFFCWTFWLLGFYVGHFDRAGFSPWTFWPCWVFTLDILTLLGFHIGRFDLVGFSHWTFWLCCVRSLDILTTVGLVRVWRLRTRSRPVMVRWRGTKPDLACCWGVVVCSLRTK